MLNKHRKAIAFITAMMVVFQLFILPVNRTEAKVTYVVDAVPSTLHIAKRSQSDIKKFIASHPVQFATTEYTENPSIVSPYAYGSVSDKSLNEGLNRINTYRYIAGLSADITLDDEYNKKAQAASLINKINGGLSHSPGCPNGMSQEMYDLCRTGAGSCNLAFGRANIAGTIDMYVHESGDLGHRRWVLNPPMKKTGLGIVENVSAMYCFDNWYNPQNEIESVWPAPNTPVEYFTKSDYWSISLGYEVDISTIKVKVTNRKTGKSCTLTQNDSEFLRVNNTNYGLSGCIIFRPQIDFECEVGDSVNVEITGLPKGNVSYTVNFFSCEPTKIVTSGIYCAQSAPSIIAGMVVDNKDNIQESLEYKWIACEESSKQWFEVSPWTEDNEWLKWSPDLSGNYIIMCYVRVKNEPESQVSASFGTPYTATSIKKKISDATIASIPDVTYTGSAVKPFVSVKYGSTILKDGKDYELSYSNNTKVGTASVKITGKGSYTGTVTKTFKIVKDETASADISYRTYVQSYGWQPFVKDGSVSGTYAQAKRLEGIQIKLSKKDYTGGISYRTYVQSYGWQSFVSNGSTSGTMGQSKRLEAIQIKLTGNMAKQYDVYYRVQAQKFGWMGWAKNGTSAGTAGFGYRLEGIQIKLVKKGSKAPSSSKAAYQKKQG